MTRMGARPDDRAGQLAGARLAVDGALAQAIGLLPPDGLLAQARQAMAEYRGRFASRIRVALIGRVGSGKSTLANAVLGAPVLATGVDVSTMNVIWLRDGEFPELAIHYHDGRREWHSTTTLDELADLTCRIDNETRQSIAYLQMTYPNPNLKLFDLIDTPGLDSADILESRRTKRFLGLGSIALGAEARFSAVAEARAGAEADALVHVFAGGPTATQHELLVDFQRALATSKAASPIATIGALTMVENYWRRSRQDVMKVGREVAERVMAEGGADRFYRLLPVASLVAAAASTLSEKDFADLTELAGLKPESLDFWLAYGPRFSTEESTELPLPATRRKELYDAFRAHGIAEACRLIRDGNVNSQPTLRKRLYERSGMADFLRLLTSHFGEGAELIKVQRLIGQVAAMARDLRSEPTIINSSRDQADLDEATRTVTQLENDVPVLADFSVICDYHRGLLNFSQADATIARRLLGEFGKSLANRLDLPENSSWEEITARAHHYRSYWFDLDRNSSYTNNTRVACEIVLRCCDRLITAAIDGNRDAP